MRDRKIVRDDGGSSIWFTRTERVRSAISAS